MASQNRYITLGGHRHRYVATGSSGQTMLLLHGISSSLDFYEQVIPSLSRSFRVLAFDFLGFGLSDKPRKTDYSLELYASLIREFLEKTNSIGEPLYATGHSMGGKYLLASGLLYPGTFRKLVLSNTDGFINVPAWARGISLPGVRQILKKVMTGEKMAEKMFTSAFYRTKNVDSRSFSKNLAAVRDREAFDTVMSLNRNLMKLDMNRTGLRKRLGELKIPVLIIWGDHDQYFSPKIARSVNSEIPCSNLVIFPECGHAPMLEYPEKFSETVREFILSEHPYPETPCS
ncbi:MAG: alpha/beta hydrolase [Chlorobium sp.]|uniref:alpha/beta fold hydrolase n=1 Tax=Chlorobium sp. TaxID=1095 RepID=UPI0025BD126C|nr:alpha/beta hydrolase [Chlorobium sp.]MCF8381974.1 alpha/beta hydrolase [Chlorobium sp.]